MLWTKLIGENSTAVLKCGKKTLGENFKNNAIDCVWARKMKKIYMLKLFYAISSKK